MADVRWCILLLYYHGLLNMVSANDIDIVGVVNAQTTDAQSLTDAVDYLNAASTPLLQGKTLRLQLVSAMDNESFNATLEVCELLKPGVGLIVDLSSRYVTKSVRCVAELLAVAHVSAVDPSFTDTSRPSNTSVNIRPPSYIMLQAIRDSVSQENLTNVGIIYDHTFNLDDKPKRLLRNIPAQHLYLRMGTTEMHIKDQLQKIKAAELQHLFLASSSKNAERYLGQANANGMMNFKYSWYVITKDTEVSCPGCQLQSTIVTMTAKLERAPSETYITFMDSRPNPYPFSRLDIDVGAAFVFDLMNVVGETLQQLVSNNEWVKPGPLDCSSSTLSPALSRQSVLFMDTIKETLYDGILGPLTWFGDIANPDIILEIKRINFKDGISQTTKLIGNWTLEDRLLAEAGSITNRNVKKTYNVVTVVEPPFVFKEKELPTGKDVVDTYYYNETTGYYYFGYCIDLIFEINKTMGFAFNLYEPADMAYGSIQEDGSWNGLVQELVKERADIAVAPLSVMAERENVIDFTVPYYDLVGITILMRKPVFTYSVFKFLTVLEEAVWGCVFSAFIIVSVLLALFDRFSPYSYQNNKSSWDGTGEEPRIFTLKEGLWFCMTSLTPQGGGEAPRALSGRLVAATWWMFGFIMIATYTANLAAFLTVSRLDQPIESLDDLAKQFETKYAPQNSTATATYFRRMADIEDKFYTGLRAQSDRVGRNHLDDNKDTRIWKAMSLNDSLDQLERAKLAVWDYPVSDKFTNMWVAMKDSGFPQTFSEALARVKQQNSTDKFAFIGDATQNKYATLTDCDLWEVGEEFSRKPYALAVQEGSLLKNELSSVILLLLNQRFLEDLKTKWWDFNKTQCPRIEDESDGISIQNIGGVFLVIFIGIGLGLLTLAFEYYWYKWRPERNAPKLDASQSMDAGRKSSHAHENRAYTS